MPDSSLGPLQPSLERGRSKWDKLPRQADFRMASHADPATWTTFEKALTAFCGDGRFRRLGLCFR